MTVTGELLPAILDRAQQADLSAIRSFLATQPSQPLVASGSGGAESAADLAALLYGAGGGLSVAVTPLTLNSFGDDALKNGKVLLLSKGGHNDDVVFATKRALDANPSATAALFLSDGMRNVAAKAFRKAGSGNGFVVPMPNSGDGFVSTGTSLSFFSLLTRIFQPEVDLEKYKTLPESPYTLCLNEGTPMKADDFRNVRNYIFLHGSWGRPVAKNLESKIVESGLATGCVCDFRNYCHGRFIFTSNHLEDSAIVLFVSPRERDFAVRTRKFLPAEAKLVIIETKHDVPEASLDLLIRATEFFHSICRTQAIDPACPRNPGRIDKRVPIGVPFKAALQKMGPLRL